jgi:hypothetical protein
VNDDLRIANAAALPGNSQAIDAPRDRANRKRVPSVLTPERQRDAVRMVRAGRFVHQVAKEFSVSEVVILELWKRDTDRRATDFLRTLEAQIQNVSDELRGRVAARRKVA